MNICILSLKHAASWFLFHPQNGTKKVEKKNTDLNKKKNFYFLKRSKTKNSHYNMISERLVTHSHMNNVVTITEISFLKKSKNAMKLHIKHVGGAVVELCL